ncbi:MAG: SOS response-associated peptidase [Chloroflexi bacterium]|nr:SOS response-associated peptidase [Chloroflexota bacterium]
MCARFTLTTDARKLQLRFRILLQSSENTERYNIAPTQNILTVIEKDGERRTEAMRWGLVPFWAKDPSVGQRMINARSETLGEKPAFRQAFVRRRCLIPADGFYEWQKEGSKRLPLRFVLKSGEPFAFAGLWETWKRPDGEWLHTCTIITTTPNSVLEPIHDRMPVILRPEDEDLWLDPSVSDPSLLRGLLAPYPPEEIDAYQVSTAVNSPKLDIPACVERIA